LPDYGDVVGPAGNAKTCAAVIIELDVQAQERGKRVAAEAEHKVGLEMRYFRFEVGQPVFVGQGRRLRFVEVRVADHIGQNAVVRFDPQRGQRVGKFAAGGSHHDLLLAVFFVGRIQANEHDFFFTGAAAGKPVHDGAGHVAARFVFDGCARGFGRLAQVDELHEEVGIDLADPQCVQLRFGVGLFCYVPFGGGGEGYLVQKIEGWVHEKIGLRSVRELWQGL